MPDDDNVFRYPFHILKHYVFFTFLLHLLRLGLVLVTNFSEREGFEGMEKVTKP
jgi:hypothetical protein